MTNHEFRSVRIPDPVRSAALTAAVTAYPDIRSGDRYNDYTDELIAIAQRFERYLTGEEANGQP